MCSESSLVWWPISRSWGCWNTHWCWLLRMTWCDSPWFVENGLMELLIWLERFVELDCNGGCELGRSSCGWCLGCVYCRCVVYWSNGCSWCCIHCGLKASRMHGRCFQWEWSGYICVRPIKKVDEVLFVVGDIFSVFFVTALNRIRKCRP